MKYAKLSATTGLKDDRVYQNGDVYLTAQQAAAIETALDAPANEDQTSEVQALTAQLETANANLTNAQSHIATLEAQNAKLQARVTELESLPAGSDAAALAGTALEAQPEEAKNADDFDHADPNLPQNQYALKMGIPLK